MQDLEITQEKLAELIGVSQSAINKLCRGRTAGTKHILKLARALRTSPEWLETGIGPVEPLPDDVAAAIRLLEQHGRQPAATLAARAVRAMLPDET